MQDLTIGQFAKKYKISVESVRFYQRQGLLSVPKKKGKFRRYGENEFFELNFIMRAKNCGLTLSDIKIMMKMMKQPESILQNCEEVKDVVDLRLLQLNALINNLQDFVNRLTSIKKDCTGCAIKDCSVIDRIIKVMA